LQRIVRHISVRFRNVSPLDEFYGYIVATRKSRQTAFVYPVRNISVPPQADFGNFAPNSQVQVSPTFMGCVHHVCGVESNPQAGLWAPSQVPCFDMTLGQKPRAAPEPPRCEGKGCHAVLRPDGPSLFFCPRCIQLPHDQRAVAALLREYKVWRCRCVPVRLTASTALHPAASRRVRQATRLRHDTPIFVSPDLHEGLAIQDRRIVPQPCCLPHSPRGRGTQGRRCH